MTQTRTFFASSLFSPLPHTGGTSCAQTRARQYSSASCDPRRFAAPPGSWPLIGVNPGNSVTIQPCFCPSRINACIGDCETCIRSVHMQCEQSLHEIPSIGESQWTGNAADQFRLRMQAMRSVLSDTQNDMERLLRDVESVMV